jgi:hypothetical protein
LPPHGQQGFVEIGSVVVGHFAVVRYAMRVVLFAAGIKLGGCGGSRWLIHR